MKKSSKSRINFSKALTLLGIAVFYSSSIFSQKFEIENKFHIKQDDKSIVFRVMDADESQLKKYNPIKNYYWFKSQKILVTQGGSSGSLLDGLYESFYKNNQLSEKGLFKKGLKEGVWTSWNPKGVLIHQENWSRGRQIGKQIYYNETGLIQKTIIYKSNQTQIIARDTTIVKTKKAVVTTINDSTGKLISQSRYSNSQLDGTQLSRNENDSLIKTVYKKGELVTEKTKYQKSKAENSGSEKLTFKQKMKNFWEKLKFWKKLKRKDKDPNKVDSPKKEPKAKNKAEEKPSSNKDEKRKEKKKSTE
ncbi:MAG: toxin-antitoxin system YwqK family antitoxin [Fluviicola sp.]